MDGGQLGPCVRNAFLIMDGKQSVYKWAKIFSPIFWTLLGQEIKEKMSGNRRNDKKCLEMGENVFPISRHF